MWSFFGEQRVWRRMDPGPGTGGQAAGPPLRLPSRALSPVSCPRPPALFPGAGAAITITFRTRKLPFLQSNYGNVILETVVVFPPGPKTDIDAETFASLLGRRNYFVYGMAKENKYGDLFGDVAHLEALLPPYKVPPRAGSIAVACQGPPPCQGAALGSTRDCVQGCSQAAARPDNSTPPDPCSCRPPPPRPPQVLPGGGDVPASNPWVQPALLMTVAAHDLIQHDAGIIDRKRASLEAAMQTLTKGEAASAARGPRRRAPLQGGGTAGTRRPAWLRQVWWSLGPCPPPLALCQPLPTSPAL